MKVDRLFETVKSKWPAQVDISRSALDSANRFSSPDLFDLCEEIDGQAAVGQGIVQAAIWPFHQALSHVAQVKFALGARVVSTDAVSIEDFIRYLKFGLEHPSWSAELEVFARDNPDL